MLCAIEPDVRLKMIYLCTVEEWSCTLYLFKSISEGPKTFIKGCPFVISNTTMMPVYTNTHTKAHTHTHGSYSEFAVHEWHLNGMYPFGNNNKKAFS